jgi:hypothetical protein
MGVCSEDILGLRKHPDYERMCPFGMIHKCTFLTFIKFLFSQIYSLAFPQLF